MAANRDEFFDRPTRPLDFFNTGKTMIAGKDLRGGGTWLGVTTTGKFSALTNYRLPGIEKKGKKSRGVLIPSYFEDDKENPREYLQKLAAVQNEIEGYNLLAGDRNSLCYYSNVSGGIQEISPGVHGLSNHLLNTAWPKVTLLKEEFKRILKGPGELLVSSLFSMLTNREQPDDDSLPETGVGLRWERILAPVFISSSVYGTRSSAVVMISDDNEVTFRERSYTHTEGEILMSDCRFHRFKCNEC